MVNTIRRLSYKHWNSFFVSMKYYFIEIEFHGTFLYDVFSCDVMANGKYQECHKVWSYPPFFDNEKHRITQNIIHKTATTPKNKNTIIYSIG